jgi:branched-chain amino acid aminotransferase
MEEIVYLNGRLIPVREAKISVMDYGFLFGYGLFETMRAYHGRVFRLDSHLKRLAASASSLKIPVDRQDERGDSRDIQANRLQEARVRLAVSIGEGSLTPDLRSCSRSTVFIGAAAYVPYGPEIYEKGYRINISSALRVSRSPLHRMKTASNLENLLYRQEARSDNMDDALLLNEKDCISETVASNIFLVKNNTLKTPRLGNGLLPGITRMSSWNWRSDTI